MIIGEIVKSLVVPTKHISLSGVTILLVQVEGKREKVVVADNMGAGIGDKVLVTMSSHSIEKLFPEIAVDAAIIGIF